MATFDIRYLIDYLLKAPLMKKGLRRQKLLHVAWMAVHSERSPDEEGVETARSWIGIMKC